MLRRATPFYRPFWHKLANNPRGANAMKAVGVNFVGRAISFVALFLTVRLLISYLGNEAYGVFTTVTSMVTSLALVNLGFGSALSNALTDAVARGDVLAQKRLVTTTQVIVGCLSLVAFGVWSAICAIPLISWDKVLNASEPQLAAQVQLAVFFSGMVVLVTVSTSYMQAIFVAHQRLSVWGLWNISSQLAGVLGLVLAINLRASLPAIVLAYNGSTALVLLASSVWLMWRQPDMYLPRLSRFSPMDARMLFKYGSSFTVIGVTGFLQYGTDTLIISRVLGPSEVAPYSVVMRLYGVFLSFSSLLYMPMWSAFANAKSCNDWVWFRRHAKLLTIFVMIAYGGFFGCILIGGRFIVQVWTNSMIDVSFWLILFIGLYYFVRVWTDIQSILCNSLNLIPASAALSLPIGVLTVILTYVFTQWWGVNGVAVGMGGALLITGAWILPYLAYKELNKRGA